jgi:serine protease
VVSSINAEAAWTATTGSARITVAVLDTGVRFDHPDLAGKLHPGYDFVSTQTGDGNGVDADATDPGDYTTTNQCGSGTASSTSSWHGTQTAGLVGAATDNGVGMASIGRNTMVLPVRVLGPCGGSDSDIIAAMYWAAGITLPGTSTSYATYAAIPANPHPAKVISMSLGKSGSCPASYTDVFAALAAAKVTVVVAAGNTNGLAVEAPANCNGALAVAGVRHIGSKVGYSSIGPQVTIAAPAGNCVNTTGACLYPMLTTINKGTTTPSSNGYSDSSDISVGTSFAAPIVAGTVGLMLAMDPGLEPAAIAAKLKSTARAFPTSGSSDSAVAACKAPTATEQLECYCTTATCGAGLLDAGSAVASLQPDLVTPPAADITTSSATVTAGQQVTFKANHAGSYGGRVITGYQWQITGGGTLATLSASTSETATLTTSSAGTVTVALIVTDSAGATGSASSTVSVQAAPVVTPTPAPAPSSGGGGAMSGAWVALLGVAAFALRRVRPA